MDYDTPQKKEAAPAPGGEKVSFRVAQNVVRARLEVWVEGAPSDIKEIYDGVLASVARHFPTEPEPTDVGETRGNAET